MKIKVKRRWNLFPQSLNEPKEFYDIYHGFFSWFRTKWIIDKGGLTESEVIDYLKPYVASGGVKIIVE
jgi:hypothetical protein